MSSTNSATSREELGSVAESELRNEALQPEDEQNPSRKRVVIYSVLAAVAVIVALAVAAWFFPVFRVTTIEVKTTGDLDPGVVREAAAITEGENLLHVDTSAAAQKVASLPRVRQATVTIALPSTVTVDVTERRVVAYTDDGDLIDSEGETFRDGEPPQGAVKIVGANDQDTRASAIAIASALTPPVAQAVDEMLVDGPYQFVLVLHDGRRIVWGSNRDNENKALAAETVIAGEGKEFNVSDPTMVTAR